MGHIAWIEVIEMVLVFMGPYCTGKSSVAELIREKTDIQIVTGKDYLRLSSNEDDAWRLFLDRIKSVTDEKLNSEKSIIYILDDAEKVSDFVDTEGIRLVKFSATLDAIKHRYEARMQGELPGVVVKMLNKQKDSWDQVLCDVDIDSSRQREIREMAQEVIDRIS